MRGRSRSLASRRRTFASGASSPAAWTPDDVEAADQGYWFQDESTNAAGAVSAWTDKFASGGGDAVTPGVDPIWTDPDSDYAHGTSVEFIDATSRYFELPGTDADNKYIHRHVAFGIAFKTTKAADTTLVAFSATSEGAAQVGMAIRCNSSTGTALCRVGDGTALAVDVSTDSGESPNEVVSTLVFALNLDGTWSIYTNGVLNKSGTISGTFSTADAFSTYRIGVRGGSLSWYFDGTIGEIVILKSPDDAANLATYLHTQHGA